MLTIKELYSLEHTLASDYLSSFEYPWQALAGIKEFIIELGKHWMILIKKSVRMYGSIKCACI